ncbi:MAG: DNA topoisomerase IB [Sandaracinaceae bacterium]
MDRALIRRLLEDDPIACAEQARLLYVDPDEPGYSRRPRGRGFSYFDPSGQLVRHGARRSRFASLAIPPAWTEVWICSSPRGHIQATGRDDAGRKQYIYHPEWRRVRDERKYDRVLAFGRLLPIIRRKVHEDLSSSDELSRSRVLASVVRLLETTLIRVGNDEYAKHNESYGLTTLRKKHVRCEEGEAPVVFEFPGKTGKEWRVGVEEDEVASVILECLETPGYELFKYFDASGQKRDVTSDDVNRYLQELASAHVTAKDFRTFAGTVLAAVAIEELERERPELEPDKRTLRAVERVANALGNTPAICRSCYIHPEVLSPSDDDVRTLAAALRNRKAPTVREALGRLSPAEEIVLRHLERSFRRRREDAGPLSLAS